MHYIMHYLPASLSLIILAIILASIVGIILGVFAAHMKGTWVDFSSRLFSTAGVSIPAFWLALMLQLLFVHILHHSSGAGWLPAGGQYDTITNLEHPVHTITGMYAVDALITGNWISFWGACQHLVMPVLTWPRTTGVIMRMTGGSMLEAMGLDYVRMARAMGMPTRKLLFKAVLKNAMGPVLTIRA